MSHSACGSMHFGLHAFDLFAGIYREAWTREQQPGPVSLSFPSPSGRGARGEGQAFKTLSQTYENESVFLRDVACLIIEYNLYGVDIDPRAAQIAVLADDPDLDPDDIFQALRFKAWLAEEREVA